MLLLQTSTGPTSDLQCFDSLNENLVTLKQNKKDFSNLVKLKHQSPGIQEFEKWLPWRMDKMTYLTLLCTSCSASPDCPV